MSKTQWVNYPKADGTIGSVNVTRSNFVDKDVSTVDDMGPVLYAVAKFKKRDGNSTATITIEPDGGNAQYTNNEIQKAPGIYGPGMTQAVTLNADGEAKFEVHLPPAGGNKFKIKGKSDKGTTATCTPDSIETRRKLFYQVIRMQNAADIPAGYLAKVEQEFWNAGKKVFIKLEQNAPGGTIPDMENFEDTDPAVRTYVRDAARLIFDKSKIPYAVAAVIVNKNCIAAPERRTTNVSVSPGLPVFFQTVERLFNLADGRGHWVPMSTSGPPVEDASLFRSLMCR